MLHKLSVIVVLSLAALYPGRAALADIYKYRDAEGRIHLTDRPMRAGYVLLKHFSLGGNRSAAGKGDALRKMRQRQRLLAPMIGRVAKQSRIRPALVHAVVRAESAFKRDAVSSKGAAGLMQLMPATARRYGVRDRFDAEQNLRGGTQYLRFLLDRYDANLELALAAYNAGESAVERYGERIPPFPETQDYVRKVINFYNDYLSRDKLAQR